MSVQPASDEDVGGMDWYWASPQTDTAMQKRSVVEVGADASYSVPAAQAGDKSAHQASEVAVDGNNWYCVLLQMVTVEQTRSEVYVCAADSYWLPD